MNNKNLYREYLIQWLNGVGSEIAFWDTWLFGKGLYWPDEYKKRVYTTPSFRYPEYLHENQILNVLDVGCGLISHVGTQTSIGSVHLHACDPLAPAYNLLLDKYRLSPYIRGEYAISERLSQIYPLRGFDLVCMTNALDHSFNPKISLIEMLKVTKIDGVVRLEHSENEAEFENYAGFHQWNITLDENNHFILWNKVERLDVTEWLGNSVCISSKVQLVTSNGRTSENGRRLIIFEIKKISDVSEIFDDYLNIFEEELMKQVLLLSSPSLKCYVQSNEAKSLYLLRRLKRFVGKYCFRLKNSF